MEQHLELAPRCEYPAEWQDNLDCWERPVARYRTSVEGTRDLCADHARRCGFTVEVSP